MPETPGHTPIPVPNVAQLAGNWQPQVVVIGLGTNDFSTPVGLAEPRDAAALEREYVARYTHLIARLRQAYGDPVFVLLSLPLNQGDKLRPLVSQLVAQEHASGHAKVHALEWGPLQARGCAAHPDADDHRAMAHRLTDTIQKTTTGWN